MIEEFLEKYESLVNEQKYEEFMDLCTEELAKLSNLDREYSEKEVYYTATIYSCMVQFLEDEEALKCLDCAIQFVPNNAKLYYQRAEIKTNLSDIEGAIEDYTIIIDNAPQAGAYGLRGNLRASLGDIAGAISDYKKILEIEPDNQNAQRAINSLVMDYAAKNNLQCLECTLKTGKKVYRIVTNFGIFDIPQ